MTPTTNQIDEKLDEWGSRLFNVSTETIPRPGSSRNIRLRFAMHVSTGGRLSTPQARAIYVQQMTYCCPPTGPFLFEFQRHGMLGEEFGSRLDTFFSQVPKDFRYAVEIRNAGLLGPDYRKVLEHHGVAHVYNHWSYMPPLQEQHQRMEDCFSASFTVLRLLTPLKMAYEVAKNRAELYTKIVEELPEMRRDTVELVKKAVEEK